MRRLDRRQRAKRRARQRGVALLMVLGAIAVLTVLLAEFQDDTSAELASALSDRDQVQAEYMARSAVSLSRLLIATEPTIRAAIAPLFALMKKTPPQLPVWAFSDRLLAAFNDQEAQKNFAGSIGIDLSLAKNIGMPPGGSFELSIVDEDSKINVNLGASNDIAHIRLAKELAGVMVGIQYDPLFAERDPSGQYHDRLSVCSAIIDWSDVDEQMFNCDMTQNAPTGSAVEDASYQLLLKPYRRKNAPYDSLEELHMVNGISDDFWSTFVDPDPTKPEKRVMTVWGQGAVNVNNASAQTLLAVVCAGAPTADICVDPNQMSMFLMGVTMARGITMGAPLFGSPNDFVQMMEGKGQLGPLLTAMGMKPVKFQSESEFAKSVTTESKVFSIYAIGIKKGFRRETRLKIHAVVDFRSAPSLLGGSSGSTTNPTNPTGAAATPAAAASSAAATAQGIQGALQANPAGTIVYYRIR